MRPISLAVIAFQIRNQLEFGRDSACRRSHETKFSISLDSDIGSCRCLDRRRGRPAADGIAIGCGSLPGSVNANEIDPLPVALALSLDVGRPVLIESSSRRESRADQRCHRRCDRSAVRAAGPRSTSRPWCCSRRKGLVPSPSEPREQSVPRPMKCAYPLSSHFTQPDRIRTHHDGQRRTHAHA